MFCPECATEYRPGFDRCADCSVALVPELPGPPAPAVDYAQAAPEQGRWELNRADSRNIAFIKGALVGLAVGQALQLCVSLAVRRLVMPNGFTPGPAPPWLDLAFLLPSMFAPLGIIVGGFWSRSRMR